MRGLQPIRLWPNLVYDYHGTTTTTKNTVKLQSLEQEISYEQAPLTWLNSIYAVNIVQIIKNIS